MRIDRSDRSLFNRWWLTIDHYLLFGVALLIVVGGLMVTTASPAVAERIGLDSFYFIRKQFVFLLLGSFTIFAISLLEQNILRRICVFGFVISIILMFIVLFFGAEIKGATRWFSLMGVTIQPSEFLKPFFFVTSAWMFSEKLKDPTFPGFSISSVLFLLVVTLLVLQPDIGTTIIVTAVWVGQFFISGLPIFFVTLLGFLGIIAFVVAYLALPHVQSRVDRFLHPGSSESYQVNQAEKAIESGGFFGRGPGEGIVKDSIPDSHTDFIYAVIVEEMGLFGGLLILGLFVFITIRGFMKIYDRKDLFIIIACAGILMNFAMQAIINIGVTLQLVPTTGMTLPFMSYGGSSVLASSIAVGVLLSLTRKRYDAR